MTTLKQDYQKLINKHYAAVQTDARLGEMNGDDDKYIAVERKSRQFWTEFQKLERDFVAKLEQLK